MSNPVEITVEGNRVTVEERPYTGAELRKLGGLAVQDKLVLEEADGSETAIPATLSVQVRPGENYFRSVRHRRG
jgi:hypothetical protein